MNFTVVCYRSDGIDSCRGCTMSRSRSDFALYVEETADAAGLRIAEKQFEDRNEARDLAVNDWELTLLINGVETDYEDPEIAEASDLVEVSTRAHLQRMIAEAEALKLAEKERLEAKELDARRKKDEAKERHDRAEFERLRQKFGA